MSQPCEGKATRRKLLRGVISAAATVVAAEVGTVLKGVTTERRASAEERFSTDNEVLRMQQDLERALRKPVEQRQWVMVIDTRKCIGCNACVVACIAENRLPPGVSYRTVPEVEVGEYPAVRRVFMPTNCQQCDNPPCMKAAPPGAISKRPDGIVVVDYTKFRTRKAFEAAAKACPYTALYFDDGKYWTQGTPRLQAYETRPHVEYGQRWTRMEGQLPIGAGRKCHFCLQRLEVGMLPACVTTCIGRAMYFGDISDKRSLVADLLRRNPHMQVNANLGTRPRVYYITEDVKKNCQVCHG
ncbi:MAG: 4Fe-4S dicluster domain-containing protein [Armatimonadota bacterium]|nr:4Fe-4S dicluster domain-containing protein [Armatimonadota bacterium]MDR5702092.1 4Fe-4S dicluster domain-containing protein [Armatimonadota bacterium]